MQIFVKINNLFHSYTPKDATMNSETYYYKRGVNQQFSQVCHVFEPAKYNEDDLNYSFDKEVMPIVIHCVAQEGEGKFILNYFLLNLNYILVNLFKTSLSCGQLQVCFILQ